MSRWRSVTMMDWMRGREREVDRSLSYWALSRVKVHSCLDLDLLLVCMVYLYDVFKNEQLLSVMNNIIHITSERTKNFRHVVFRPF